MSYSDFLHDSVLKFLGITAEPTHLFGDATPLPVPDWLRAMLERGQRQVLMSEKARSEFLVVPVLLACEDMHPGGVSIYSGQRLDVDIDRGLVGECDFILAATPAVPALQAPLITIVEAKKNDVESGIWQCIAQMAGARLFNERAGRPLPAIFGCVTNGEIWQFLRLKDAIAGIDQRRYYIDNVGGILAVFQRMIAAA